MKNILKSKIGFTLIELLVVIGILAVLAAIAIPSVAGLIDRANISADATNANEMTNAIERFTSKYELYCQDIASGRVKTGDLDSAQGRVFNVTGADSREDIELLESTGLNGKQINRDTKYPTNATTMQSLVENYMKTSSTTFTPKQSDCHYYYSPDCGVVVCTETAKSSTTDLNKLIQSGKDAKGKDLSATTQWIDMTLGSSSSSETIVGSATFDDGTTLTWEELQLNENGNKYGYIASAISNTNIGEYAFQHCASLTNITIIDSVTNIDDCAFLGCVSLANITIIDGVINIDECAFECCTSLNSITLPNSLTNINRLAFSDCYSLNNITYNGTKAQWNAISLGEDWNCYCSEITVSCIDGTIVVPSTY